ncbi:PPP4R2-domain-containing protein [Gloeopeniophorella convolvens]|nr:PPP4R2-domain-containing protein [Gloeopeniophorella convolvens]
MSSSDFVWLQEYDVALERISSTDILDIDWPKLRDIIKHKIDQNIAAFLADAERLNAASIHVPPFSSQPSTAGGLKLPPFTSRERDESNPTRPPGLIYAQLDVFDAAPFTIQRLADLCARPRENYAALGKYLRALERALYVTSTWDSFPPLPPQPTDNMGIAVAPTAHRAASPATPSTPLFSPIPFLHDDARRSHSRSPPPSPMALNGAEHTDAAAALGVEPRGLGLVDELDDPGPGHLSDRPTALSSVTSSGEGSGVISLEDRFVRAAGDGADEPAPESKRQKQDGEPAAADAPLDEQDGDKENKS